MNERPARSGGRLHPRGPTRCANEQTGERRIVTDPEGMKHRGHIGQGPDRSAGIAGRPAS